MHVLEVVLEGTMSQILYLGLSFIYFYVKKRVKALLHYVLFHSRFDFSRVFPRVFLTREK